MFALKNKHVYRLKNNIKMGVKNLCYDETKWGLFETDLKLFDGFHLL